MNSVYDRPLFANKKQKRRDARTKLLNMGGIVASSPELMQAVSQAPRSMNQGGYIPGYDEGGFIHNMKHRREDAGLPSIMNQIKTGTIPPVGEQPSFNFLKNMLGGGSDVDISATAGSVTLPGSEEVATENVDFKGVDEVNSNLYDDRNEITTEEFTGPEFEEFEEVEAARQAALDILTGDSDEITKANQLATQVAGQPLSGTEEEQTAQYKELIQQAFGKKANAKTIAGLNRQITGFTIAAGKDPRAVVNIANGLKAGAEAQKAQLEADQTRADLIAKATLERGFQLEDAATKRSQSVEDIETENTRAIEAAKLLAESREKIAGLRAAPDSEKTRAEIRFGQAREQFLTALLKETEYIDEFLEDGKTKNPEYRTPEQLGEEANRLAAGLEPNAPGAVAFLKRNEKKKKPSDGFGEVTVID